MIDVTEIKKLALLARLKVAPEELESLRKDIDAIIGYVSEIEHAPVKDNEVSDLVNPTPWLAGGLCNVMREDGEAIEWERSRGVILSQVSAREGEYIKVKKIL